MTFRRIHIEGIDIEDLGGASDDLAHLKAKAGDVAAALVTDPLGERCGRKRSSNRSSLCAQRRVLIILGWLPAADYEARLTGGRGEKAIQRLQKALGVPVDGDWGTSTQDAFLKLLKTAVGPVDASATVKSFKNGKGFDRGGGRGRGAVIPPTPPKKEDAPVAAAGGGRFLMAGLGVTAILAGAAAWWMGRDKASSAP